MTHDTKLRETLVSAEDAIALLDETRRILSDINHIVGESKVSKLAARVIDTHVINAQHNLSDVIKHIDTQACTLIQMRKRLDDLTSYLDRRRV